MKKYILVGACAFIMMCSLAAITEAHAATDIPQGANIDYKLILMCFTQLAVLAAAFGAFRTKVRYMERNQAEIKAEAKEISALLREMLCPVMVEIKTDVATLKEDRPDVFDRLGEMEKSMAAMQAVCSTKQC